MDIGYDADARCGSEVGVNQEVGVREVFMVRKPQEWINRESSVRSLVED